MVNNLVLISISKDELKEIIQECVKAQLDCRTEASPMPVHDDDFIGMPEVQKLLSVSKVTIHKWKSKGIIPYHKLNRRLFFKRSEILNAVKNYPVDK